MEETIVHQAVVEKISPQGVTLRISDSGDCGSCRLAALCAGGESRRIVAAPVGESGLSVGRTVRAVASSPVRVRALLLLVMAPLLSLCGGAAAAVFMNAPEPLVALGALGAAVLCFMMLYIFRGALTSGVVWKITDYYD